MAILELDDRWFWNWALWVVLKHIKMHHKLGIVVLGRIGFDTTHTHFHMHG
jgi:hypothetical protein